MKSSRKITALYAALMAVGVMSAPETHAQMIYGNTFPFWNVTGDLTVGGAATFTTITATSGVTFSGAQSYAATASFASALNVSGLATFSTTANFNSAVTVGGAATFSGTVSAVGAGTFGGAVTFNTATTTNGAAAFASGVTVSGVAIFSGGILGSSGGISASSANVGALLQTTLGAASAVSAIGTTSAASFATLDLTPGEWDVSVTCNLSGASFSGTVQTCGVSLTANVAPTFAGGNGIDPGGLTSITFVSQTLPDVANTLRTGPTRILITSNTTLQAVSSATFTSGSYVTYGNIRARRAN